VGYAARYRLRGSAGLCVGIAAGNALYIVLVIIGWSALRQFTWLFTLIELCGALYLLWIGSHLVRSQPQALALNETHQRPARKQILLGLGSALLNPKNALFYLALMTALLGPDVTLLQQATCGVWMVMVVLAWDLALVSLMGLSAVNRSSAVRCGDRAHGGAGADGVWRVGAVAAAGSSVCHIKPTPLLPYKISDLVISIFPAWQAKATAIVKGTT
jgi:threonine/homoserine/homoserine lactone efflux protein